jgi:hypothetical protein
MMVVERRMLAMLVGMLMSMRMVVVMRLSIANACVMMLGLACLLLAPKLFPWELFFTGHNHVNFGGADAATVYTGDLQARVYAQSFHGLTKQLRRNSGIDQRTEEHVAADSGKAF